MYSWPVGKMGDDLNLGLASEGGADPDLVGSALTLGTQRQIEVS